MPYYFKATVGVVITDHHLRLTQLTEEHAQADAARVGVCALCIYAQHGVDTFKCVLGSSVFYNIELQQPGSMLLGCDKFRSLKQ